MAPGYDGRDDDDPDDRSGLGPGGALELVVQPQGEGDDSKPEQLPSDFEDQDGKHAHGIPDAEQCQEGHGNE